MLTEGHTREKCDSPRPRPRWGRWIVGLLTVFVVLLVGSWWALTSSWFLAPRVAAAVEEIANLDATIGHAEFLWPSTVSIRDATFRVRGIGGAAGEILLIDEARIDLDPVAIRRGEFIPVSVDITGPRMRVSENLVDGTLNLAKFRLLEQPTEPSPLSPSGPGLEQSATAAPRPPSVTIRQGMIEVGAHDAGGFRPTGLLPVEGTLVPEASSLSPAEPSEAADWYRFDLAEIRPPADPGTPAMAEPLKLAGRMNFNTGAASIRFSGLSFDDQHASILPRSVRRWWDAIQPSGLLAPVSVRLDADGEYRVDIPMDGVDWSLPIQSGDSSLLFAAPPRVTGVRGSVVLSSRGAELVGLSGVIDGVRYRLRGEFGGFDASAPFDISLEFTDFDIARSREIFNVFPRPVRELIEAQRVSMGDPRGLLSARLHLQRQQEPGQQNASMRFDGRLELTDFSFTYAGFPYSLRGLDGAIEFDENEVRVVSLAGVGPTGAKILLSGRVFPLGPDPAYEFDLYAVNVPIDEALRQALPERNRGAISTFFDQRSAQSLLASGAIISRDRFDRLKAQLTELLKQRRELEDRSGPAAERDLHVVRQSAASLEDQLNTPVFDLGGTIDLRVKMTRPQGPGQHSDEIIDVTLPRGGRPVGLLFDEFPYPVFVADGAIRITPSRIDITRDLLLVGATGGRALVSGTVGRIRTTTGKRLEPDIRFTANQVPFDDLLLHAVPGDRTEDPDDARLGTPWRLSRGAIILGSLGLQGRLLADGRVFAVGGATEFDVMLQTEDALIGGPITRATSRDAAWAWPAHYMLSDVSARVRLTSRDLLIESLRGRHESESLAATGSLTFGSGLSDVDLQVSGDNVGVGSPLPEIFAGLAEESRSDETVRSLRKLDASGSYGFVLCDRRAAGEVLDRDVSVEPADLVLAQNGHQYHFSDFSGRINLLADSIEATGLAAELAIDGAHAGTLHLEGRYTQPSSRISTSLTGMIRKGVWESGIVESALRITGHGGRDELIRQYAPRGLFDARFGYIRSARETRGAFACDLIPTEIRADVRGREVRFTHESGRVRLADSAISLHQLRGRSETGAIEVEGRCDFTAGIDAQILLTLSDQTIGGLMMAVLPRGFVRFVESQMIAVRRLLEVDGLTIRYRSPSKSEASLTVNGRVWFGGAEIKLPLAVTDAVGYADVDFNQVRSAGKEDMRASARMSIESMKVAGRTVGRTDVDLHTADNGRQVVFPSMRGELAGGVVTGEGRVGLEEDAPYELALRMSHVGIEPLLPSTVLKAQPAAVPQVSSSSAGPSQDGGERDGPGWGSAWLSISGIVGRPETRVGRGALRVDDATIYHVPAALWVLQMSAMSLPTARSFSTAEASFFVDGSEVVFESMRLGSPAITLTGLGSIRYPTGELDLWFDTVRNRRMFIITDVWEALRDTLFSIHVAGTIAEPRGELLPLGSMSRAKSEAAQRVMVDPIVDVADARYILTQSGSDEIPDP